MIIRIREHDMQSFRSSYAAVRVRSGGFTLADLLVLVAIFVVMIALIIPGIQNGREAARRAQCKNNLHMLGLAMGNSTTWPKNALEMRPAKIIDDHVDTRFLLAATTVIFATVSAMFGALFIRFAVQIFNRRGNRLRHGIHDEQESSSLL